MKRRIEALRQRIREAAEQCGRDPDEVRLVAVAKTWPAETVRQAVAAGIDLVGESYIQEARMKIAELADTPVSWHFIGHLQSNKAKYAVRLFDLIHTVDSAKLGAELDKEAQKIHKIQDILLQVNTGMEASKSGVSPKEAPDLAKALQRLSNLRLRGLMTIPPFYDAPDLAAPYFRELRLIRDRLQEEGFPPENLKELSMGMSGDFEVAIREGATLVRVGSALFGERV
ncbi:MAG: YggS family pyridoxal phosphate-dependent enzyme [Thermodesulfobacteriota bacterium]